MTEAQWLFEKLYSNQKSVDPMKRYSILLLRGKNSVLIDIELNLFIFLQCYSLKSL